MTKVPVSKAESWLVIRLFTDEVADLAAMSRIHDYKVRFRWNDDRTVDVVNPPAWAVTWLESRRGQPLPELGQVEQWKCIFCYDLFDGTDDDRPPVCLMCRKAHRFGFDPGSRVRHKHLTQLGEGVISLFQPDLPHGVIYVLWNAIPPGLPQSGRSLAGLPCPDRTLRHGWNTLQPLDHRVTEP